MKKPTPVVTKTVCSVCDLDWHLHGSDKPGVEKCIELLKAEAKRPRPVQEVVKPWPYKGPVWTIDKTTGTTMEIEAPGFKRLEQ